MTWKLSEWCVYLPSVAFSSLTYLDSFQATSRYVTFPFATLGDGTLNHAAQDLEVLARDWVKPPPDAHFSLRVPVEYASFQAARYVNGPYIWVSDSLCFYCKLFTEYCCRSLPKMPIRSRFLECKAPESKFSVMRLLQWKSHRKRCKLRSCIFFANLWVCM